MKLVLNNRNSEVITFSSFNRQLDIANPEVQYIISLDFGTEPGANNGTYLAQYANKPITNMTVMTNDDNVVAALENVNAALTSFNEFISDSGYSGSASIVVNEKVEEE